MAHKCPGLLAKRPRNMEGASDIEEAALRGAENICNEDVDACRAIGQHGLRIIQAIAARRQSPVHILTHCNAGWLAFVDIGSATAPIYAAHDAGIPARDCGVPFYVAFPSSTLDLSIADGLSIPIEERGADEVLWMEDDTARVRVCAEGTPAANPAFDITPARRITGLITEYGVCDATEDALTTSLPSR